MKERTSGRETFAARNSFGNMVKAYLDSPLGVSFPRVGTLGENQTVVIEHRGRESTKEIVTRLARDVQIGSKVVVHTRNLTVDEVHQGKNRNR